MSIDKSLRRKNQLARARNVLTRGERIKILKLLWDSVGTEFAGRHELYERNYSGGWEDIRAQALTGAERGGSLKAMEALVDQCLADYDENGWTGTDWQS